MNTHTNKPFNPREHLITIKNRQGAADYLTVQWRLVWFREQCPGGTIFTELVHMDLDKEVESEAMQWDNETRRMKSVTKHGYGVAVFKATITDGRGGSATGYGSEKASDFGDFLEKAETKSIGRALAALGYGTQFAPEISKGEEERIVDAPVSRASSQEHDDEDEQTTHQHSGSQEHDPAGPAIKGQVEGIKKLCDSLGKEIPDVSSMTFLQAKKIMQTLTAEYRQMQADKAKKKG